MLNADSSEGCDELSLYSDKSSSCKFYKLPSSESYPSVPPLCLSLDSSDYVSTKDLSLLCDSGNSPFSTIVFFASSPSLSCNQLEGRWYELHAIMTSELKAAAAAALTRERMMSSDSSSIWNYLIIFIDYAASSFIMSSSSAEWKSLSFSISCAL